MSTFLIYITPIILSYCRNWLMKELGRDKRRPNPQQIYLSPTGSKIVIREQVINYLREHGQFIRERFINI